MRQKCFGSLLLLFFIAISSLAAEETEHKYILKNANTVKIDITSNDTITTLTGDVDLIYNGIEFFADNGQVFQKEKKVKLYGNVRAIDDTLEAGAQKAIYLHEEQNLQLENSAYFIEHSDSTQRRKLTARFVEYNKAKKKVTAVNDIIADDYLEDVTCECGKFVYDLATEYGLARDNPVLKIHRENEINIYGKQMELFAKEKKFTATYEVKVEMKDSYATSNFLIYFDDEKKAVMLGNPHFTSDVSNAYADEFQIFFEDEAIKELVLVDNAVIHFQEEKAMGKENYLYAKRIVIQIANEKLSYLNAKNVSKSFFEQKEEDTSDTLINKLATANLEVFFNEEEKIKMIIAENDINGRYLFSSSEEILKK